MRFPAFFFWFLLVYPGFSDQSSFFGGRTPVLLLLFSAASLQVGRKPVALSLEWIIATVRRRCTAPQKEGKEGVRSAVAVLLRVVVLRSEAETTLRPRGLTGEAWACAHSPPAPLVQP